MIQIRLVDGQGVLLQAGDKLTVTDISGEAVTFPIDDVAEFRFGDAELRLLSGRNANGDTIRAIGLYDEELEIAATSPPINEEAMVALIEQLQGKPVIETYQAIPKL